MRTISAVLLATVALAGCSGEEPTSSTPTIAFASTPTSTIAATRQPSSVPAVQTPTAPPEIVIYGKRFSVTYYECADKLWSQRVAKWSQLTNAERDRWAGAEAWMKAKGWPVSHEATLEAPATRKACPPGR